MARTKGSKNRSKVVRNMEKYKISAGTMEEKMDQKYKILELLTNGTCNTITDAALLLGLKPVMIYSWGKTDPEFKDALAAAKEVLADRLEGQLANINNFIPKMFLLKAIRPEYKDNFRFDGINSKMEDILKELKAASQAPVLPAPKITVESVEGSYIDVPQLVEKS